MGPYHTGTRQSLVAKTWNCYSYRWWWLVQLGHVLVQSITVFPIIDAPTQVELGESKHTTTFQHFLLIVCFCFSFGLCLLMFSFALYFCQMGSHPWFLFTGFSFLFSSAFVSTWGRLKSLFYFSLGS